MKYTIEQLLARDEFNTKLNKLYLEMKLHYNNNVVLNSLIAQEHALQMEYLITSKKIRIATNG